MVFDLPVALTSRVPVPVLLPANKRGSALTVQSKKSEKVVVSAPGDAKSSRQEAERSPESVHLKSEEKQTRPGLSSLTLLLSLKI